MSAGIIRVGLTPEEKAGLMKVRLWAAYQCDWYYCTKCGGWVYESDFFRATGRGFTVSGVCKSCHRQEMNEVYWRKQNAKKI